MTRRDRKVLEALVDMSKHSQNQHADLVDRVALRRRPFSMNVAERVDNRVNSLATGLLDRMLRLSEQGLIHMTDPPSVRISITPAGREALRKATCGAV